MLHTLTLRLTSLTFLVATGCVGTLPRARDSMSAAEHQAIAQADEHQADLAEVSPRIPEAYQPCQPGVTEMCWNFDPTFTPTQEQEAQRLRSLARQQEREAADLRNAEQRSCSLVPSSAWDRSPLAAGDLVSVSPYYASSSVTEAHRHGRLRGAVLVLRPTEGATARSLSRWLECRHARLAVLGYPENDPPDGLTSPIDVPDSRIAVHRTNRGLAVTIVSDDPIEAAAITDRALALDQREQLSVTAQRSARPTMPVPSRQAVSRNDTLTSDTSRN